MKEETAKSYTVVTWRHTLPEHQGHIYIGLLTQDGEQLKYRLPSDSARHLAQSLSNFLPASHSESADAPPSPPTPRAILIQILQEDVKRRVESIREKWTRKGRLPYINLLILKRVREFYSQF